MLTVRVAMQVKHLCVLCVFTKIHKLHKQHATQLTLTQTQPKHKFNHKISSAMQSDADPLLIIKCHLNLYVCAQCILTSKHCILLKDQLCVWWHNVFSTIYMWQFISFFFYTVLFSLFRLAIIRFAMLFACLVFSNIFVLWAQC